MRDVLYIAEKDHQYTVFLPGGVPFAVWFKDGIGGHFPEPKNQLKPGKGTAQEWVRGVPDVVADAWLANMQPWKSGFVVEPKPVEPPPRPAKRGERAKG